ncbi:MAG: FAD-dependent oxidoreductase [Oscillospiraceae bacterium]|nr:FAD-dependent oxidoreductase [Oscillospiraceae bacterium]
MSDYQNLLQPLRTKRMELKNRILFSPTYPFFCTADNHINRELIEWVRGLAVGGAACVAVGTGSITPIPYGITLPDLSNDSCINQLTQMFDTVHAYDCKAGIELVPIGGETETFDERDKKGMPQIEISPDNYDNAGVKEMIGQYIDAAVRVQKAGGDYVVIHGAHLQPPAAFFSKLYNHRHDEYGCDSFENRCRFTVEILDGIRAAVGDALAIEYRISGTDMMEGSPEMPELIEFVKVIEDKIDWLHVSRGQLAVHKLTPYVMPPLYFERGFNLPYAEQFKKALHIPVSCVGGMDYKVASQAIADGKIDLVSMSRPLLADHEIARKLKRGKADEIKPCIRCNTCIHRTHNGFLPVRCAINPTLGREMLWMNYPAPEGSRKVAVVGGGPAGMEAARTAAKRGHKVTLYEKQDKLGGALNLAAASEMKADIRRYIEWSVRMVERDESITVKLNTEATPAALKAESYDAVLVAVGSEPLIPDFLKGNPKAVWVGDVDMGNVTVGDTVIIAGAGMTGMECAVDLSRQGKKVTLIDMASADKIGTGGAKMNILALREMMELRGVEILPETRLEAVTDRGITVTRNGEAMEMPCDTLVLSLGVRARTELARSFADCAPEVVYLGDCNTRQGTIFNATRTAYDAAMAIL